MNRRVESTTDPLVETGPMPVKETDDPTLAKGKRVTDEFGSPPRETSVHRLVYDASGKLLYDNTWNSYYVGEPSLVRVGTKEPPKKPVKPKKPGAGDPTTTTPTDPTVDDDRPDRHGSDGDDSRSAVAIASTNHGGTRVGCRVAASTVAWSVSAVATSSPSRSIRYS